MGKMPPKPSPNKRVHLKHSDILIYGDLSVVYDGRIYHHWTTVLDPLEADAGTDARKSFVQSVSDVMRERDSNGIVGRITI